MANSYIHPGDTLRLAALDYAAAVEAGEDLKGPWDRLRVAALRYRTTPRRIGRWRKEWTGPRARP
jgi:hypothetical protein